MARGLLLLLTHAVGSSVPFVLVSLGLNWPLAGSRAVEARSAGFGQLINLEL